MFLIRALCRCAAIVGCVCTLSACADLGLRLFQPYRVEIQQGNFVSREQVEALKVGMSREQVRFVLGTPMLQDAFHASRWDYPFYIRRTSGQIVQRKLVAVFEDDRLVRWQGDEMPYERPPLGAVPGQGPDGKPIPNPDDVAPTPPQPRPAPQPPRS